MVSKKRVGCIYRVSTKGQLEEDEIPMQRNACLSFIEKQEDWVLAKEYYGKGITGYRTTVDKRDDIQEAKKDAEDGEIDVLLCFMFDRVGRSEEESPFVLRWFADAGVETWSVMEGQQKFEHHVDLLTNYIRFWQAEGESEKTSQRVNEDHEQMAERGLFRGGTAPYGYKLVKSGIFNKKDKELYKRVIDDEQSKVVQMIYDLVLTKGWGSNRITKYLNSINIKTATGGKWNTGAINYILTNPTYKGYPAYGRRRINNKKVLNKNSRQYRTKPRDEWIKPKKQIKELVIVDEEKWDRIQEIRKSRSPKNTKMNDRNYTFSESPLLFVGIINCGHCGSPLTTTYNSKQYKSAEGNITVYRYPKYRCSGKALGKTKCNGQTIYGQKVLEETILNKINERLDNYEKIDLTDTIEKRKKGAINTYKEELHKVERERSDLVKELNVLSGEISKSLLGESKFSPEVLSGVIDKKTKQKEQLNEQILMINKKINEENQYDRMVKERVKMIPVYREEFSLLDVDEKKVLIRELVKKVTVSRGKIEIAMKIF